MAVVLEFSMDKQRLIFTMQIASRRCPWEARNKTMNLLKSLLCFGCSLTLLLAPAIAAEKSTGKKTCCQEAAEKGKECRHKCCVAAHKDAKSCQKCNPGKEDLKLKKADKKGAKAA